MPPEGDGGVLVIPRKEVGFTRPSWLNLESCVTISVVKQEKVNPPSHTRKVVKLELFMAHIRPT